MFSKPEVFAHNLETVPRIFKRIRPAFAYERSLDVITQAKEFGLITKSNLILGMGEERTEVSQALKDLHAAGCDLVTITQYLRPTAKHHPISRWVKPNEFVDLAANEEQLGLKGLVNFLYEQRTKDFDPNDTIAMVIVRQNNDGSLQLVNEFGQPITGGDLFSQIIVQVVPAEQIS